MTYQLTEEGFAELDEMARRGRVIATAAIKFMEEARKFLRSSSPGRVYDSCAAGWIVDADELIGEVRDKCAAMEKRLQQIGEQSS